MATAGVIAAMLPAAGRANEGAASAMTGVNVPVDCGWLAATPWNTYGGLREANG